jgi:hypothetical protein
MQTKILLYIQITECQTLIRISVNVIFLSQIQVYQCHQEQTFYK